jgi:hypothetical protein
MRSFPDNPSPGFGQKTLAQICAAYNLNLKGLLRVLAEKGINADSEKSIKEIAEKNGKEIMALFEVIHEAAKGQDH